MARVRICPSCGHANPLSNSGVPIMRCKREGCGTPISRVPLTDAQENPGDLASPETGPTHAVPKESGPPPKASTAQAQHVGYALEFAWGRVAVASCLNVGREPAFSPIAEQVQLADAPATVSRMHATVYVDAQGLLQLKDLGATNCTYVNGDPIAQGKPIGLGEGDEVSFSSSLKATVHRIR